MESKIRVMARRPANPKKFGTDYQGCKLGPYLQQYNGLGEAT